MTDAVPVELDKITDPVEVVVNSTVFDVIEELSLALPTGAVVGVLLASGHRVCPLLPPLQSLKLGPQNAPGGQYQSSSTPTHWTLGSIMPPHVDVGVT